MNQNHFIYAAVVVSIFLGSCASKSTIQPAARIGLPQIYGEDMQKLQKEAVNGNEKSAQSLHLHFLSVKQPEKALQWLRVCALLGDTNSKYSMYVYLTFKDEDTLPEERAEALIWLTQAAKGGHAIAIEKRKRVLMQTQKKN